MGLTLAHKVPVVRQLNAQAASNNPATARSGANALLDYYLNTLMNKAAPSAQEQAVIDTLRELFDVNDTGALKYRLQFKLFSLYAELTLESQHAPGAAPDFSLAIPDGDVSGEVNIPGAAPAYSGPLFETQTPISPVTTSYTGKLQYVF